MGLPDKTTDGESETYTVSMLRCRNCSWEQPWKIGEAYRIPKGQPIAETPCPRCGVCSLNKRWP